MAMDETSVSAATPEIGRLNRLKVVRQSEHGLFLNGGSLGDILLPKRYVLPEWRPGDTLDIFLMLDSEDRLVATTLKPHAMVDEFAYLRVVSCSAVGAFLDWGLPKDLLVPFREQNVRMQEGRSYAVRICLDEQTSRIVATAKLDRFLGITPANYAVGEAVDLLICAKTDLGYKAIVNGAHWGMIFHNKVFQPIACGQRMKGFIQQVREDGKIDLALEALGYDKVHGIAGSILTYLESQGGFMPVTDKNPPAEIYALFGVSKKIYKQAIGALYKARRITFEDGGTKLVAPHA